MQKNKGVLFATAQVSFTHDWKFLATSEGSFIEQVFFYTSCGTTATARHQGQVKTRNLQPGSIDARVRVRGRERPASATPSASPPRRVEHAMAKPVQAGLKDLVLLPSHLALTIHEIIAHPTELDRIVGYEANYAGTSFVKLTDLGKLKYGSHAAQHLRRSHAPGRDVDRRLRR